MLYRIGLSGFLIDASTKDDAYRKAIKRLRESPESAIAHIGEPGAAKNKSILYRLLTGK
jgi:hypothetical protein